MQQNWISNKMKKLRKLKYLHNYYKGEDSYTNNTETNFYRYCFLAIINSRYGLDRIELSKQSKAYITTLNFLYNILAMKQVKETCMVIDVAVWNGKNLDISNRKLY